MTLRLSTSTSLVWIWFFFTWHCMSITCEIYIYHHHHCIERDSHSHRDANSRSIDFIDERMADRVDIKDRVNKILWYVEIWETLLFTANWITQRGALRLSNKSFSYAFFFLNIFMFTVTIIRFSILSFESHWNTHLRLINYIYAYIYIYIYMYIYKWYFNSNYA